MLDNEPTGDRQTGGGDRAADAGEVTSTTVRRTRRRAPATAKAETAEGQTAQAPAGEVGEDAAPVARATRRRTKAVKPDETGVSGQETSEGTDAPPARSRRRKAAAPAASADPVAPAAPAASVGSAASVAEAPPDQPATVERAAAQDQPAQVSGSQDQPTEIEPERPPRSRRRAAPAAAAATVLFMAPEVPDEPKPPARAARTPRAAAEPVVAAEPEAEEPAAESTRSRRRRGRRTPESAEAPAEVAPVEEAEEVDDDDEFETVGGRRRRRRGRRGRGRGKGTTGDDFAGEDEEPAATAADEGDEEEESGEQMTRRRRRRRRSGSTGEAGETTEDGVITVVKVRPPRGARDEVQGVSGSTRLEAKRQRRRDGREQRRTRPPILSESEFLARREAVDRAMAIRQKGDRTQIAVLEDKVLVEHYVTRASAGSMVGNVYLGKVQNVLPSMEAAFVDIGRGRNAVLYAGEVNWDATGLEGRARSIEQALKSGDSVLVQVTKDPIGHKGARLTSHIALSGRHLVYVPHGNASGISRKLPDTERKRLRDILKNLIPDGAGVIVRTAAEGAAEDELERDVTRLQAQWEDIRAKASGGGAPVLLYEEPDLVIRVVRDLFNEDFKELVIQGSEAYEMVELYLKHVSPDLVTRLHRYAGSGDVFTERRIDEQILKGLDRKVYLPSGGSLVIDRTEAMTVIDVNTGKYTGTGGNLEETVTRNNLEAAEEIVRQLRLRDLGGIIVIDFIDMVLESNRELVLRRLTECLGRDRTKHQVTEITSLGLVQMTRKRIGQGLLEAFSETCEHCKGRGLIIHTEPVPDRRPPAKAVAPVEPAPATSASSRRRGRKSAAARAGAAEVDAPDIEVPDIEVDTDDEVASGYPAERLNGGAARGGSAIDSAGGGSAAEQDADAEDDDDAIEEHVVEQGNDLIDTDYDPIDADRFRASIDDPDAVDGPGISGKPAASSSSRRRVLWGSRRGRPRP